MWEGDDANIGQENFVFSSGNTPVIWNVLNSSCNTYQECADRRCYTENPCTTDELCSSYCWEDYCVNEDTSCDTFAPSCEQCPPVGVSTICCTDYLCEKPAVASPESIYHEIATECEHFLVKGECNKCNMKEDEEKDYLLEELSVFVREESKDNASVDNDCDETEEKRLRNKEAAAKYRNKIKSRLMMLQDEEKELSDKNILLNSKVTALEKEVLEIRKALIDNAKYWREKIGITD